MNHTAAICYAPDGYDTSGARLLGRQVAGEGFLKGLITHGSAPTLYCYADNKALLQDFARRIQPWARRQLRVTWIPSGDARGLAAAGTLYRPDLVLEGHAWQRRHGSQRDYSICGVTHTIATKGALDALGRLLLAPLQAWDALVCPSRSVRAAVERIHAGLGEYLGQRFACSPPRALLQLPVIPLGVDCEAFAPSAETAAARAAWRAELGIGADDIAVLYVGRLIHYAKAHPVPMYLALEQAAQLGSRKLHLIQAGWFEQEGQQESKAEQDFKSAARAFCPSVRTLFLDGRKPQVRSTIWVAADLFLSLSDNIQETFGITPIEAMAAGLPVVVSDWDGYRESVRDGVDGFTVPTRIPSAGTALDWSRAFGSELMSYSGFIANAAMATAVDVELTARRVHQLAENAELRRSMGQSGQRRAREAYDWSVVIAAYEALWGELAERRASAPEAAPLAAGSPAQPLCDDPFRLFGHYASAALEPETMLCARGAPAPERTRTLLQHPLCSVGHEQRAPEAVIEQLLEAVRQQPSLSMAALGERFAGVPAPVLARTLGYLLKLDLISTRAES